MDTAAAALVRACVGGVLWCVRACVVCGCGCMDRSLASLKQKKNLHKSKPNQNQTNQKHRPPSSTPSSPPPPAMATTTRPTAPPAAPAPPSAARWWSASGRGASSASPRSPRYCISDCVGKNMWWNWGGDQGRHPLFFFPDGQRAMLPTTTTNRPTHTPLLDSPPPGHARLWGGADAGAGGGLRHHPPHLQAPRRARDRCVGVGVGVCALRSGSCVGGWVWVGDRSVRWRWRLHVAECEEEEGCVGGGVVCRGGWVV